MRQSELWVRSTPLVAAGLATVWLAGKLVATAWASIAAEAGPTRPPAEDRVWLWWILALVAVMVTLWTARRLRHVLRVRPPTDISDDPILWI